MSMMYDVIGVKSSSQLVTHGHKRDGLISLSVVGFHLLSKEKKCTYPHRHVKATDNMMGWANGTRRNQVGLMV